MPDLPYEAALDALIQGFGRPQGWTIYRTAEQTGPVPAGTVVLSHTHGCRLFALHDQENLSEERYFCFYLVCPKPTIAPPLSPHAPLTKTLFWEKIDVLTLYIPSAPHSSHPPTEREILGMFPKTLWVSFTQEGRRARDLLYIYLQSRLLDFSSPTQAGALYYSHGVLELRDLGSRSVISLPQSVCQAWAQLPLMSFDPYSTDTSMFLPKNHCLSTVSFLFRIDLPPSNHARVHFVDIAFVAPVFPDWIPG